jgi:hypothetical protein
MDNSTATKPFSKLKGDPYRAYEELPFEVRRALQEALVDWCPLRAREWHQRLLRERRLRPAQVTSFLVQTIRRHDHAEVAAFAKTWPKGAEAYPHLAAEATLQRYVGTEGIPAAEPIPPAPPPPLARQVTTKKAKSTAKPPKPSGKRSKAQAKRKTGRRTRR